MSTAAAWARRARRGRVDAGLHPRLAGNGGPMGLGQAAGRAARARFPAPRTGPFPSGRSPAGPARPSWRCRSYPPTGRSRPLPFEIDELRSGKQPRRRRLSPLGLALVGSRQSPPSLRSAARPVLAKAPGPGGGAPGSRTLDRRPPGSRRQSGAGSSRRWSTRRSPWCCRATPSTTPCSPPPSRGLDAFASRTSTGRRIEACQSPVWDTALAVIALLDAGTAPDDPAIKAARDWLLEEEVTVVGDWSVRRPNLAPGGWAFEFQNVHYPDIDDTAEVVIALRRAVARPRQRRGLPAGGRLARRHAVPGRGLGRLRRRQHLDVADPTALFRLRGRHRPADRRRHRSRRRNAGRRDRARSPGLTGGPAAGPRLALRPPGARRLVLGPLGRQLRLRHGRCAAGSHRRRRAGQGPTGWPTAAGGSWSTRTPTAAGVRTCVPTSNRAGRAGRLHCLADSVGADRSHRRRRERDNPATETGVGLARAGNQTADGTWDEPWFTGTGFPWDFSLNYHLYRHVFPLTALGRYLLGTGPRPKLLGGKP